MIIAPERERSALPAFDLVAVTTTGNPPDVSPAADVPTAPAPRGVRRRLPRDRTSRTFEFRVADCKGFVTVGEYEDGTPGEIFVRVAKQGTTLAGLLDAFAISVSHGLQWGVPLESYVDALTNLIFEPKGMTDDAEFTKAESIIDFLFRKLAVMYLTTESRQGLGVVTAAERSQLAFPGFDA